MNNTNENEKIIVLWKEHFILKWAYEIYKTDEFQERINKIINLRHRKNDLIIKDDEILYVCYLKINEIISPNKKFAYYYNETYNKKEKDSVLINWEIFFVLKWAYEKYNSDDFKNFIELLKNELSLAKNTLVTCYLKEWDLVITDSEELANTYNNYLIQQKNWH